jgi:hypothetical protein
VGTEYSVAGMRVKAEGLPAANPDAGLSLSLLLLQQLCKLCSAGGHLAFRVAIVVFFLPA